ncbi:glycosyltransferase family 1 protein [Verrucomicrobia bacterium S94]|nr:glycosyltransferase family 1 protein [Verrucomicrobia bacterium S94]
MKKMLKYNFVGNPDSGDNLNELRRLSWDEGIVMCARHAWVWPLYCQLKMKGLPVLFNYELQEDAVNFVHAQVARVILSPHELSKYFVVVIRADYRSFPFGRFEIVQNKHCAAGTRRIFMPHYPQPGLLPRMKERTKVENVCFSGQANNFCLDKEQLGNDLEQLGCKLIFRECGEWQDMREVDVLLGIRSLSKKKYHSKPPTKLFNAWLSRIPFIGGYDSAYEQVGRPGTDFLRVSTYSELLDAVSQLKKKPELYNRIVESGLKKGENFTAAATTERWVNFIEENVVPAFNCWNACEWSISQGIKNRLYTMDKWYHRMRGLGR